MSSSAICTNILYFNIFIEYITYIVTIFLYIFGYYILPIFKFPNFNNNIVLYFLGVLSLYPFPKILIKLNSGIFLLGLHHPQVFLFLPIIILVMFLHIFGCMCL